ncbi:hypothetical protein GTO27_02495 [Candidatus Bathyarchaeota archaeon]|nr:hypothetical protein [Candidatus Bathyarchaeota archaeon]
MRKRMEISLLVFLLILPLLLTSALVSISKTGATGNGQRHVTLEENAPSWPMPENYTTEDYLNTTNPYSQISPQGEETDCEGSNPLYVLVFGDEEERSAVRALEGSPPRPYGWISWATMQLERGDESLTANFGIDIRILDFLEWDSDDSIEYMSDDFEYDLCDELLAEKGHYLDQWYAGEHWSNYVDCIIGITSQATPETASTWGVAPSHNELDQGKIFVLLKWMTYWKDDNLAQHEISHLFYADDHRSDVNCCVMASTHTHFQTIIWEGYFWFVFAYVPCDLTAYSWCPICYYRIESNRTRYLQTLTISATSGGETYPEPGTYKYNYGESVSVLAIASAGYSFVYWLLDGYPVYDRWIHVTMNSDHDIRAFFRRDNSGGGGGTPGMPTSILP